LPGGGNNFLMLVKVCRMPPGQNGSRRNQMDVPERGCPHPQPLRQTWPRGILWMRTGRFTRCGWDSRAPNAVGATGRAAIRWTIEAMGV